MNFCNLALVFLSGASLAACGAMERVTTIGAPPPQTKITNPTQDTGYMPVSLPMPAPNRDDRQENSLWASNRQTFFKDQRATDVGDILTVLIDIKDEAQLENETERKRTADEGASLDTFLGYEQSLAEILPEGIDNTNLVQGGTTSNHKGEGSVEREEEIKVKMAALITQVLPNGNFVIHGRQEVRVNFENRIREIDGVIRPQDVTIDNSVSYEKIAEARISYGGKGQITDVQQPRYGQQLYDVIFPF